MTINAPQAVQPDSLQPNNTSALATNLDDMTGISNLDDLAVTLGSQEWFKFTLPHTGTTADQVSIDFDQSNGSLQLQLFAAGNLGQAMETSDSATSAEQMVSLDGLTAEGVYFLEVNALGGNASIANNYNLHVDFAAATATAQSPTTPVNAWTIIVYMTVDNLGQYAEQNLIQMQNAAAQLPGNVKIAVLLDQNTSDDFATGSEAAWEGTGEAIIQPSSNTTSVATTFNLSMGKQDTGIPGTLQSFIEWAATNAPAQHYALIMWDHGGGLPGSNEDLAYPNAASPVGYDIITSSQLDSAILNSGVPIEVLGFDAC